MAIVYSTPGLLGRRIRVLSVQSDHFYSTLEVINKNSIYCINPQNWIEVKKDFLPILHTFEILQGGEFTSRIEAQTNRKKRIRL